MKYTQSGKAVASFTLAVQRQYKNANGEYDADYINCQIWRKMAEVIANHTHKGTLIGVEGRLQTRNYENQQGQRVYVTEVIVDNVSFLSSKNDNAPANANNGNNQNYNAYSTPNNTNTYSQNSYVPDQNSSSSAGQTITVQDSDLPF